MHYVPSAVFIIFPKGTQQMAPSRARSREHRKRTGRANGRTGRAGGRRNTTRSGQAKWVQPEATALQLKVKTNELQLATPTASCLLRSPLHSHAPSSALAPSLRLSISFAHPRALASIVFGHKLFGFRHVCHYAYAFTYSYSLCCFLAFAFDLPAVLAACVRACVCVSVCRKRK